MPQLDKVTFFAQVTWSLITYIFLYFLFSVHVGPAIGRVLKVRSKINLAGSLSENQQVANFSSVLISVIGSNCSTPKSFLKISSVATKLALSSTLGLLRRNSQLV